MDEFRKVGIGEMSCCICVDEIMREIQCFKSRQIGFADIKTAITANTVMILITHKRYPSEEPSRYQRKHLGSV